MVVDKTSYILPADNYAEIESIKKQIVIGHSSSTHEELMTKWITRLNGKYTKTAAYTIDKQGRIYQHFDPIYFSNILGNVDFDKKSVVILLENEGWLIKNEDENQFLNWVGHIYNKPEEIFEKRWRNYLHWAPYTNEQLNSTIELVDSLCKEFSLKRYAVPHNTKIDDLDDFNGVLYKSNIFKHSTDVSPSWNFEEFKFKFENR